MDETCCFRESLKTSGGRRGLSIQAEPGPRSWPHHQQGAARSPSAAYVDVVFKHERGDVGSSPGRVDGSCITETDKERVFNREGMKENAKKLSASRTHRSTKRGSGEVTVIW